MGHDTNNNIGGRPSSSNPSSSSLSTNHQNEQDVPVTNAARATPATSSSLRTPWTGMAAAAAVGITWTGPAAVRNTRSRRNSTMMKTTTTTSNETEAQPSTTVVSSSMLKYLTNVSQHLALHGLVHGVGSDISLRAFGKTYRLHRLVLLQATFFENMLQGPWQENCNDTVDMTFDDSNITQEGFEIAIGRLYGIWVVEREDESDVEDGEYELDYGARLADEHGDMDATHSPSKSSQPVPPSILSPQNVLSVLAIAAYLGVESLCKQCTEFAIRTLRTDHLLPYIEFSYKSDYYPWSDKIVEACHSYLCRNGFEDPKMICLQIFEQLPVDWLLKVLGSDAFWVPSEWERYERCRQIVHRRRAISAIVRTLPPGDNSSSAAGTRSESGDGAEATTIGGADNLARNSEEQEYEDEDEMAYEALFSSGIIYMHMSFEQLQCIQRDIDPISGSRFVRSSVIQEALWHQVEFRNLIEAHGPKEPIPTSSRRNSSRVGNHSTAGTGGGSTIGLVTSAFPGDFDAGYEGSAWIRRPFAMYKPIPKGDTTLTGENDEPTLQELTTWNKLNHPFQPSKLASAAMSAARLTSMASAAMPASVGGSSNSSGFPSSATSFWSQLLPGRHLQPSPPSNPAFIQLNKKQRAMDSVSDNTGSNIGSGYGLSGVGGALGGDVGVEKDLNGQYPIYPPFRFSVAFGDVKVLKENTRVCSDAFFYAGSYWNLYIQKLPTGQPGGIQLGVYLHRHSLPTVAEGTRKKPGLPHFFIPSAPSHSRSSVTLGGPIIYRDIGKGVHYINLPTLPRLTEQLRRLQQSSVSTAGAGLKPAGSPGRGSGGEGGNDGSGAEVTNTVTAAAAALFEDSFSCFVDRREMTKTWFKIYVVGLGPGHEVTQFQSSPDEFAVMQSWGWRSSNLCSTAYLPESPVPKDDVDIKLQTGCNCTGLLISTQGCSSMEGDTAAATIFTTSTKGTTSIPTATPAVTAVDRADSVTPIIPATAAATTTITTTMVTDATMDVEYVHEYEYDEDSQQQHPQQGGQGPVHSDTAGSGGAEISDRSQVQEASGPSIGPSSGSPGCCRCGYAGCSSVFGGGTCGSHAIVGEGKIFIQAPLVDTLATDQYDDGAEAVEGGSQGPTQGVTCNCEAQSRYGSGHHHHPLQATMLQF
ncbi:hypothetical protein BGZ91_006891, partial [Linnemannia elongata]